MDYALIGKTYTSEEFANYISEKKITLLSHHKETMNHLVNHFREVKEAKQYASLITLKNFYATLGRDWSKGEVKQLKLASKQLLDKLASFGIHLEITDPIYLIKAHNSLELGQPHCRNNKMIFPGDLNGREDIFAHEFFHILTHYFPEFKSNLFKNLGFVEVTKLKLPTDLLARKGTNPDVVFRTHALEVVWNKTHEKIWVLPYLYQSEKYREKTANYSYPSMALMTAGLLVLERDKDLWRLPGNKVTLLEIDETDYKSRLFQKDSHVILNGVDPHPEEVLAYCFETMIFSTAKQCHPDLVKLILEPLRKLSKQQEYIPHQDKNEL